MDRVVIQPQLRLLSMTPSNATSQRNPRLGDPTFLSDENCVFCPSKPLTCPPCEPGFVCQFTIGTCAVCPAMTCAPDHHFKGTGNAVTMAVGISATCVVVVGFIILIIARRQYVRHREHYGVRIEAMGPTSPHPTSKLMERRTSLDSSKSKFPLLANLRSSKRNPSATFSELNFDCHETFPDEEEAVARPIQAKSPTHLYRPGFGFGNDKPPENLNGLVSPKIAKPNYDWMWLNYPAVGEGLDLNRINQTMHTGSHIPNPHLNLDVDTHLSIQFPKNHMH
ncbi:hypothetical protein L0F63_004606 [Massospora cicadina]|nr:hypothetical protein L0F63_004606 [Massospora cicadina]